MIRFFLDEQPYELPSNWAEVPRGVLPAVAVATLQPEPTPVLRLQLLRLLCPALPPAHVRRLLAEDRHRLVVGLTEWIWQVKIPAGLLTEFQHAGQAWLLPDASFGDVSLAEYIMVHHQLRTYCRSGAATDLAALLATSCRPPRPAAEAADGLGLREKYNGHVCEGRAGTMATAPLWVSLLVLPQLTTGLQRIYEQHRDLFSGGSAQDDNGTGSDEGVRGLIDMAYGLAEQRLFGDFDATCSTAVHTVLDYLDYKRRHAPKPQAA
jgi:hypothetical protein